MQRIIALFSDPAATGWVYDNQDLTTMFQDVAGTVPAISPGQRVRLQLDKSGKGNHRRQPSGDASAPILGRHPAGGRRNLLTWTEDLTNVVWAKTGNATITPDQALAPNGTTTADLYNNGLSTAATVLSAPSNTVISGTNYTFSIYAKRASGSGWLTIIFRDTDGSNQSLTWFNLNTGAVGATPAPAGRVTRELQYIEAVGDYYRIVVSGRTSGTNLTPLLFLSTTDSSATRETNAQAHLWGAQLELGATATPYQRVTIADDCTEAGVADRWYLRADGVDDWLETSAFAWGTDKATICAGVRKLSDVSFPVIVETSANPPISTGSMTLIASASGSGSYLFGTSGTSQHERISAALSSPRTNVVSAIYDIGQASGIDEVKGRINGADVALSPYTGTTAGTGNFGTYPAYFFRRGGTSLPFNGFEYANIAINRLLTPADLALVEGYVTGVTLQ